jgi:hypothetical protein
MLFQILSKIINVFMKFWFALPPRSTSGVTLGLRQMCARNSPYNRYALSGKFYIIVHWFPGSNHCLNVYGNIVDFLLKLSAWFTLKRRHQFQMILASRAIYWTGWLHRRTESFLVMEIQLNARGTVHFKLARRRGWVLNY